LAPITPSSVGRVNTVRCDFYARLAAVDLRDVRIKRLELFAQRHGAEDNPSKLGLLIGKKPNQVYNLLHRHASFGEKVARSIEEAAGLPRYWLDTEETASETGLSPEAMGVATAIDQLTPTQRKWALRVIRETIDAAQAIITSSGNALGKSSDSPQEDSFQKPSQRRRSGR
jgi:hypothetical protein